MKDKIISIGEGMLYIIPVAVIAGLIVFITYAISVEFWEWIQ